MSASTGTDAGHGGVANRHPEDQAMTNEDQRCAFIDWARRKHKICLLDAAGQLIGERNFAHSGAGLAEPAGPRGAAGAVIGASSLNDARYS
jgi:hypothetical protein